MKKVFTKLLVLSALCFTSLNYLSFKENAYSIISNEFQNSFEQLSKPNLKFSVSEGTIVAQIILNEDYNFVDGKTSDETIELVVKDGVVEFKNLKPNTKYTNVNVALKNEANKLFTFKLNEFTTPDSDFIGYSTIDLNSGYVKINFPQHLPVHNVSNISISDSSLDVVMENNNVKIENLENEKFYSDLSLKISDNSNNSFSTIIEPFKAIENKNSYLNVKVYYEDSKFFGVIQLPKEIIPKKVEISDKNLNASIQGKDTILISGLSQKTDYKNLKLNIIDSSNEEHQFFINKFSTTNKNFNYADIKLSKSNSSLIGKIILPEKIKINDAKFSDNSIEFSIKNNNLIVLNLRENTFYENLKLIVQDDTNKLYNFVINDFSTYSTNINMHKLSSYVKNAYKKAFDREHLDEEGFNFWIKKLSTFKSTARDFILNILDSNEFLEIAKSPHDKITRIYGTMFKRNPDAEGLKFWMTKYDEFLSRNNDEKSSVLEVVKEMSNSKEFQKLISDIGIKY